ncbi:MAG: hypothetical protein QOI91_1079 [Solirubrobacteraceae bacterium]|jgi:hypothetical protein|nr:hypothetical protein [Solirubrobacteraceae bacterium]
MEAATPLRMPHVRTVGDQVVVDALSVTDETVVRLVREREEAGGDPVAPLLDALEIGARVLDREQTGTNVEAVKAEMEKAARDLNDQFAERAGAVSQALEARLDAVFSPDSGHLSRALERHFSDGSSEAVQHRVKALVAEVLTRSREDLQRQFSAEDERNPLGDFKRMTAAIIKQASDRQDASQRALLEKMNALELEVQRLHAERDLEEGVAAERERGTAKGRDYEELVFEALDAIAGGQGDDCDAVGDVKGTTRKTGDIVVAIDGCRGPARGRIVFEAKNSRLSKPEALRELDRGRAEREADYAVLVVPAEDKLPAKTHSLREFNGDKLLVVYDPEEGSPVELELAYRLARARVLMARGGDEGIDAGAIAETVERALGAMEEVRSIKQKLTGATTSIDAARDLLDALADSVRGHLTRIDGLLAAGDPDATA